MADVERSELYKKGDALRRTPLSGLCGGPGNGLSECHRLRNPLNRLDKNATPTARSNKRKTLHNASLSRLGSATG